MSVDAHPFIGLGYMLRKTDTPKVMDYEKIFDEIMSRDIDEETDIAWLSSDCYCGDWIFIGVTRRGSDTEIELVPYGDTPYLFSNGDDIDLDVKRVLGSGHPFFKYAKFGFFFGTDYV